jgi:hypothetical protein
LSALTNDEVIPPAGSVGGGAVVPAPPDCHLCVVINKTKYLLI